MTPMNHTQSQPQNRSQVRSAPSGHTGGAGRAGVEVRRAEPVEFALGLEVALAAQQATGFPSDVDAPTLGTHLARRQREAAGVWLAFEDGQAVGHALVAFAGQSHPTWGPVTDPLVAAARGAGRLVELGALSVHPRAHRRGIATALQAERLAWARERDLLPVAAAWDASQGSSTLCARAGRVVGHHPDLPITLYCLDR